ncbi:YSIRK-type signal peptide-containing protein [Ligilactobacillus salivarius]|uniref:YSIRK-type signal peptide-containing protein n=4 Tax=Ligilactobacillus salivarius TaxID=1624 RepID=UPI003977382B
MVSKNNYQFYQQKHADGKQRWGLRKLSVGVASVLLGTTFMLHSNHAVSADTVSTTTPTDATVQTDSNVADHQGSEVTLRTTADKEETVATTTNAEEKVVATNTQDTTQDKDKQTNANETTQNTTNVDKKDLEVTPTNDAKTPATQNATNVGNEVTPANGATTRKKFVRAALLVRKAETPDPTSTPTTSNNEEPSTSLPMSNQDIKLDSQPMLTEITNKPKDNWVYNNLKSYADSSTAKVKEILQNNTTNDESGKYYFGGVANYNESLHVIYLLARSNNLNDNNLYVTILHTGLYKNIQEAVVAPGESKKVPYSKTKHTPIFTNYDGTSVSIGLDGLEKGDNEHGMVVGFAYGYDTGISGDQASMGKFFMMTPMPTKTTNTIHYIDQATGDELAVPKSFEGVAYQKYTITGEAPTIDGYTLKKSPNTTGSISPYKVGESYDFRLDKHVVVKQTVIDSQGLVRVTAYYDGEAINNTTRYLGNIPNVNDHYSFFSPDGKSYTYINQITSTNDGIVYYYAKDGSEDKSEVRVHYIDVTGNKGSLFVPGDGKEVARDTISGKLGEKYNYNVNLPTDYNLATNQANTVNGTYTIDHHDEYVYVVKKTSAEKITPKVPSTKEPVANTSSLTETEKAKVQKNVEDANKGNFPDGTTVTVGDDGTATINYPDTSSETIPGSDLVRPANDADKTTPNVPTTKEPVADPSHLTDDEKNQVKKNVEDANKDENGKSTLPEGTTVDVGDNGTVTITYPDHTTDTIQGSDLVRPETDAEKIKPNVPTTKEPVADPSHLTDDEKNQVKKNVEDANKDENGKSTLPEGTTVDVGDNGTVTITYPDHTTDTIQGSDLVRPETDAEKIKPNVPTTKEPVADPSHLTDDEKNQVKKNVEDANKDENGKSTLPEGTTVDVGDNGTVTITYPDHTTDTIQGSDLVRPETDAEKIKPNVPTTKEPVADPSHLTDDEKNQVKKNVEDANKDENGKSTLPEGTTVDVGDNGTVTITYPDHTTDTIQGSDLVRPETDAEKIKPNVPTTKEPVADPSHLTDDEKNQVKKNVEDANKDENGKSTLPEGTTVDVGDNGTVTITYPDHTTDTIQGSDLVRPETDAEKIKPNVPTTKEPVADPSHLTDDEKNQVKKNVEDANKDENGKSTLPEGTTVDVGDNGTVTITYPDHTTDTIQGSDLVRPETDAEKIKPNVPTTKEPVADPSHLTDDEKNQVKKNVEDANKDENGKSTLPEGTTVDVGDNGTVTITYPDHTTDTIQGSDLVRPETDAEKIKPNVPTTKEPVADPSHLTDDEKNQVKKNVEDANKDENGKSTLPEGTTVDVGDNGTVTITYPDHTTDTIQGSDLVRPETDAEKIKPNVPTTKEPVADPSHLTDDEKNQVKKNVEDANKDENGKSTLPEGTTVDVGDNGTVTITYPDHTTDTIQGSDLVRPETDAEKIKPNVPTTKEPVADPSHLTDDEKNQVKKNVEDANKDENGKSTLPEGTTVDVGDNGTVTITYPDHTTDTIQGSDLVRPETDAEKIKPNVPTTKEPVADPSHLTDDEKNQVKKNVEDANKDENGKSTLPEGTTVDVGDNGTVTITYPDHTTDTIQGSDLVRPETDAEKIKPNVPTTKEPVADPSHLTDDEKNQVKKNVEDANKDENGKSTLPEGTTVDVGDNGTATITYPDHTTDTIQGSDLVRPETDAEKIKPNVPTTKEPVADPSHLTDDEKNQVKKNVEDANKDENGKSTLPDGTTVTVGDNGDVTVTYPDGSKDTIPGDKVVEGKTTTDSENNEPKVPGDKVKVDDPNKLTEDEKSEVVKAVEDANKDENGKSTLPEGSKVTVGDNGDVTVTYPDGSKDTIPGDKVVEGKSDADNTEPKVSGDKVKVDDPNKLTEDEKSEVVKAVEDANKDENGKSTLPEGSKVTVGDNGDVTVTYPDGSKDTIPGDKVVEGKSDADKNEPKEPGDKVKVDDPNKLTEDEKSEVVKAVEDANKDENGKSTLPDGTTVTVGDNGDVTVTYPDGSKDTIPGDKVVEGKTTTDSENNEPKVPGDKVKVDDPNKLTDSEKSEVVKAVEDANKNENGKSTLPEGSKVTVGDNGDVTVTYPDGSKDTIPGDKVVEGKSDADKNEPKEPGDKVKVDDPNKLTEDEKSEVVKAVEDANKDENGKSTLPEGSKVTVGDNGDVTVTYPDGSKDTIPGDKVVEGKTTTDSENNEPKVPGDKVKVDDPNKLTEDEKSEVVKAVEDANKDENGKSTLPEGSKVTVGDNGDVTVTYPDGSKDTIPGDKVVEGKSDADKNEPKEPGDKVKVDDPNKLTEDEKSEVVKAVEDANKDENGKSTLPEGSKVTVGDNGDVTVTYPDGSKDTIPGDKVVEGKTTTDSENNEPKVPGDKVKVDDPNKLTEDEKSEVVKAVEDANKDENGKSTLPEGTTVTVGDNGDVTVTYPDGSKDTIPGDKVVEGKSDAKSDADNNEPKVSGDKVKVDDPNKLTEDEKSEVVKAVEDANKDENGKSTLPEGSKVTVGDNGDVTVTYPDGSKDTIPGDKVVEGKTTTDSESNEPKVPGNKVKVDDPNKLTDSEKSEVVKAVEDANKNENGKSTLPEGSKVTVGDNGDVTVTYPDGSKDTIPGDKVLEGKSDVKSDAKSDADKNEPKEPGDKVKVDDPNKLTDSEKEELSNNLEKLNPGTVVTIADDGTATLTYPDGSTNIIAGSQLVVSKDNVTSVVTVPTSANKIDKNNYSLGKKGINNSTNKLPQTGENNNSQKLSIIGMTLMGILGLFGLDRKKKKN